MEAGCTCESHYSDSALIQHFSEREAHPPLVLLSPSLPFLPSTDVLGLPCPPSFLEQRFSALESRYGRELQGLQQEKQQLQELLDRQSRLVGQLQGEVDGSTANSSMLQRQQALLTNSVQQLLAMVNHCNGKAPPRGNGSTHTQ